MRTSLFFSLLLPIFLSGCIKVSQMEQRIVVLPQGHPKATLQTAQQIVASFGNQASVDELMAEYPDLPPHLLNGIQLLPQVGHFAESGKEVLIMIKLKHQGEYAKISEMMDFVEKMATDRMNAVVAAP